MNFVFTVCDQAAGETCPVWPGHPITAHWGIPDPAAVTDDRAGSQMLAFRCAFRMLERRIKLFVTLPLASLDQIALTREVDAIGRLRPDTAEIAYRERVRHHRRASPGTETCYGHIRTFPDRLGGVLHPRRIALGQMMPGVFHVIGDATVAQVNLPVAVLVWLMIVPMLLKIDLAALREVGQHWRGIASTVGVNWLIKPFSMALAGLDLRRAPVPASAAGGADQQLHGGA